MAMVSVFLTLFTLLLGPPLILHALLTGSVDLLYRVGVAGVRFIARAVGMRVDIEGQENIPAGVCLFAANHTSNADPLAIVGAIPRRIAILAKKELFEIPIVSRAFRLAHFVPVDRSDRESALASLDQATEYLKQGTSFLVYPEGTRSPDGRLLPFKKGSIALAIKAGIPVVPVACAGAHRIMRKGELRIHPGEIVVRFLPAIDASAYRLEQRDKLTARVRAAIAAALPPSQQPLS
jgi:1-acyl-sn-glycerol-3-phosphate acyltransferase